jgi:hypothetical protein
VSRNAQKLVAKEMGDIMVNSKFDATQKPHEYDASDNPTTHDNID